MWIYTDNKSKKKKKHKQFKSFSNETNSEFYTDQCIDVYSRKHLKYSAV